MDEIRKVLFGRGGVMVIRQSRVVTPDRQWKRDKVPRFFQWLLLPVATLCFAYALLRLIVFP